MNRLARVGMAGCHVLEPSHCPGMGNIDVVCCRRYEPANLSPCAVRRQVLSVACCDWPPAAYPPHAFWAVSLCR